MPRLPALVAAITPTRRLRQWTGLQMVPWERPFLPG